MKKILSMLILIVATTGFAITAYAHSGRTDENGGHRDRSTGEYHYHHGYSAHYHTDLDGDGVDDCPFSFKYKKDEVSSAKTEIIKKESLSNSPPFVFSLIALSCSSMFFLPYLYDFIKSKRKERDKHD